MFIDGGDNKVFARHVAARFRVTIKGGKQVVKFDKKVKTG